MTKPSRPWSSRCAAFGAVLLLAAACRSDGDNNTDRPDAPPGGGDDDTIQSIQDPNGGVAIDQAVTLRDVVVLAKDTFGTRTGNIYLGEPGGGEYSGVLVFGVDPSDVDAIEVGDLVDLEGAVKTEFALSADTSGRTTTELAPAEGGALVLTKVGTGTVPAPSVVDAAALAAMDEAARDAEWEKWEGVLVKVEDLTITEGVGQIGDDPTFLEFVLEGDLHVDNSLAEIPAANAAPVGDCVNELVGIGDYFFSWKVLPRATTDVDISGTDCGGIATSTVAAVQAGTATGPVRLENVVVTAVSFNRSNLWVQDAATSAAGQGIFVYRGGSMVEDLPANIEVGATVDIVGTATEFDFEITVGDGGLTQITGPSVTFVGAPGTLPTPVTGVTIAQLNNTGTGEPLEGVLVQLSNVAVSALVTNGMGQVTGYTLTQGADSLKVNDTVYRHPATMGACYATFTGIFGTNTFDDHLNLLPRSAADVGGAGTCD